MANIKFSAFTAGGTGDAGTTQLVGYKTGDTSANYRYSISDLATMLSPSISTFYSTDGTIGTTRKALITDTIQFRDSTDTSDIFSLNTTGAFALGLGATPGGVGAVTIGQDSAANQRGVSIGRSVTSGIEGVCIGYEAGLNAATGRNINIGTYAQGSGTASIMLRSAAGFQSTNTTAYSFSVYMTSAATPDFEVIGGAGAESTLNSSLKITGQAYTELHTEASAATITPDWNNGNVYTTELTNASTTFADPTNIKPGATYIIILKQDGTGSRTVSWGTKYKFPGGTAPTLTTGANKADVITLVAYSTDILMCTSVLDFVTS